MRSGSKRAKPASNVLSAAAVKHALAACADAEKAAFYPSFFKTGKGQYGEGDVFIGVTVPLQRTVARQFRSLPLREIKALLFSKVHEHRLTALIILTDRYRRSGESERKRLVAFYLHHRARINNWDLVDCSAPQILGAHLLKRPRSVLYRFACSNSLWERRIAIVATQAFIRAGDLRDTVRISELLLNDEHDLIHKAAGWMLREAGKQNKTTLLNFLDRHAAAMPRTMLRYAIEKLSPAQRTRYMNVKKPGVQP